MTPPTANIAQKLFVMLDIAIIGSREFTDYEFMKKKLDKEFDNLTFVNAIISGGAKGADSLAEKYAEEIGRPMVVYRPDYKKYGRAAPFVRNTEIIEHCDVVFAFWNGKSNGTRDALNKAEKLGKQIHIIRFDLETEK